MFLLCQFAKFVSNLFRRILSSRNRRTSIINNSITITLDTDSYRCISWFSWTFLCDNMLFIVTCCLAKTTTPESRVITIRIECFQQLSFDFFFSEMIFVFDVFGIYLVHKFQQVLQLKMFKLI